MLSVLKYPNPTLKKVSKPLKDVPQAIRDLARAMFETMYVENGIGLAAPQIGELIRLVVVDVPLIDPIDPEKIISDPIALINPEIVQEAGFIEYEEGCLSCPELIVKVPRKNEITVAYLDLKGKKREIAAIGLKAVCIQHEIDHLNGTILVDRLGRLERDLYKTERVRIATEKDRAPIL
ncbi:MAG: peptide deformylase [Deltaproteobacteria bacterium]|nr:peptide deformylase [Deltaproteobacteria bacterium]